MLHWLKYPFIRFTPAYIAGILIAVRLHQDLWISVILIGVVALLYIVLLTAGKKHFFSLNPVVGFVALSLICLFSMARTFLFQQNHSEFHFSNYPMERYTGTIDSWPEQTKNFQKVVIEVTETGTPKEWKRAFGRVLLYVPASDTSIRYGTKLMITTPPDPVEPPGNPKEFDYRMYLANKNIFHRQFLRRDDYLVIGQSEPNRIIALANHIRNFGVTAITEKITNTDHQSIAKALLLGVRGDMSDELMQAYAHAGVIHILAISGLHLGILYGFMLLIFRKYRKTTWFVLLTVVILWSYATIAGLSPSVTRAALMFSIFSIGQYFYRTPNIFNTIAFSAFVLLIINPMQLFNVGFQLSYLAVIGIVWLHPSINSLFASKYKVFEKIWSLTSVGIAAQILTFPLVLHYFHNYPLLFFISNLIVVPAAGIILVGGLAFLISSFVGIGLLSGILATGLGFLIGFMNRSVLFIENIPGSYIKDIHLPQHQVVMLYLFITGILVFLYVKNFKWLFFAVTVWVIFILSIVFDQVSKSSRHWIVVYDVPGVTVIDIIDAFHLASYTIAADAADYEKVPYHTGNFRLATAGMGSVQSFPIKKTQISGAKIFSSGRIVFLIISKSPDRGFVSEQPFGVDYIIISNNAVKDFSYLQKLFTFKKVIFDSSNDYYYLQQAAKELDRSGLKYHNVRENGAFIIDVDRNNKVPFF